ncbi:MAG TPA: UDP-N-acetylmuramate dehydrogenase [Candidatus Gracilibacteria bacterium]
MITTRTNVPLSKKTFYGIGGPADELIEIEDPSELGELWAETIAQNIPKIILGKGSNMAFSDKGFRGRVFLPLFDEIHHHSQNQEYLHRVTVDVGCNFQKFIEDTNKEGFEDLCPLSGIPGNVGGFIRGNAGAYGAEIKDFVTEVQYFDENGLHQKISGKEAEFEYRGSLFKKNPNLFILRATFTLQKRNEPETCLTKSKTLLQERWKKYPPGRSGGCVFKNPGPEKGLLAGKILDEMGAKGDRLGDMEISQEHANFIVNKGEGKQADLIALMKRWQKKVQAQQGVTLEPEIYLIDELGERISF